MQASFLRLVSVTEATVDSLGMELTNRDLRKVDADDLFPSPLTGGVECLGGLGCAGVERYVMLVE